MALCVGAANSLTLYFGSDFVACLQRIEFRGAVWAAVSLFGGRERLHVTLKEAPLSLCLGCACRTALVTDQTTAELLYGT